MNDPLVLLVQGVDTAGAEGATGDVQVFAELECATRLAVTSVYDPGPGGRHRIPDEILAAQIRSAWGERPPDAVRTGTFADPGQLATVGAALRQVHASPIVVGYEPLTRPAGARRGLVEALQVQLLPLARVLVLRAGLAEDWGAPKIEDLDGARGAVEQVRSAGASAVLLTGVFSGGRVVDLLQDGDRLSVFDAPRIQAARVEGLGVAHASALTAHIARGLPLERAAAAAQRYVAQRLERAAR